MFKEDWEDTKKVFEEWWNNNLERPLIQVMSPKADNQPDADHWEFIRYYPDPNKAMDLTFQKFDQTRYDWEAYPNAYVNIGPGSLVAFLGGDLSWDERTSTSWFTGNLGLEALGNAKFNSKNKWWKYTCQAYRVSEERCKGKAVPGFTDLLDAVTVTAMLRGEFPTRLVKDMFVRGADVRKALEIVHNLFVQYFEESCKLIKVEEHGYSTWARLWSKRSSFTIQCDFIVYLSPNMFRTFVLPLIEKECQYFERTNWHLDGPLSIRHLDDLLGIEELDCIQWVPGAGSPDSGEDCWVPLYKKIQENGKKLQIYVPPEKVIHILDRIDDKGVAVNVTCNTRAQRDKLMEQIMSKFN